MSEPLPYGTVEYGKLPDSERWYCVRHMRRATHTMRGTPCCDPTLGGILVRCECTRMLTPDSNHGQTPIHTA